MNAKILSADLLDVPPMGCINVHGSLLPAYRGAAPIHWAIINGEKTTGITTMFTDIGLDTGDMLLKRELPIPEDMTVGELHDQMAALGAEVLKETILHLINGTLKRIKQEDALSSYAPIISKDLGLIDWTKSAEKIHNLVRGTDPWPGAYTFINGERMRVWKTEIVNTDNKSDCGKIINISKEGILVNCGKDCILIKELQFDSSKRMSVAMYLVGHKIDEDAVLA